MKHAIPFQKLIGDHFGVSVKKKSGDHFGVNLRISSGSGIISKPVQLLVIFNVRDFDFSRRVLDGFPDLSRSYEGFFNSTAYHCDSEFRLGFTILTRCNPRFYDSDSPEFLDLVSIVPINLLFFTESSWLIVSPVYQEA